MGQACKCSANPNAKPKHAGESARRDVGLPADRRRQELTSLTAAAGSQQEPEASNSRLTRSSQQTGNRRARAETRPTHKRRPRRNKNLVQQYGWLEILLESIVRGSADMLGAVAHDTGECCTPLFVLAGTCPAFFPPCPMQAALFSLRPSGVSDVWWVKPKSSTKELERNTLSRHSSGSFKNNSERSRSTFEFLLQRFKKGSVFRQGVFTYGVDGADRAFIEEVTPTGARRRMVIYFIWVEQYSIWNRNLEGKLCYESPNSNQHAGPHVPDLRSRQFSVEGLELRLGPYEDEEVMPSLMPGEGFQEMY